MINWNKIDKGMAAADGVLEGIRERLRREIVRRYKRLCFCGDSGHNDDSWCLNCNQCVDCCECGDDFFPASQREEAKKSGLESS